MNRAARVTAKLKQQLAKAQVIDAKSAIWQLAQHVTLTPVVPPAPAYEEICPRATAVISGPTPVVRVPVTAAARPHTKLHERTAVIASILAAMEIDGWRPTDPGYAAGGQRSAARLQALQAARRELVKQIYWSLPQSYRHKYSVRTIQRVHEIFCDMVDAKRAPEGLRTVAASTIAADLKHI